MVSVRNPHMDGVEMIPAETIFWGFCYRGYRYAQPTAKHGLSLIGIDCIYAMHVLRATFQSPLQLRGGRCGDYRLLLVIYTATRWSIAVMYRVLSMMVYTSSVGASGSSPALRTPCPRCVCFGRPSSRPYSYAMGRCGCLQGVIGGIYMQCRGEWKLARVASGMSAMRVFRATSQSPLQLRGEALR